MRIRGIHYDVGTTTLEGTLTREAVSRQQVEWEMAALAYDLHANAVRIVGRDPERLVLAGEAAARLGLEVWLSPLLANGDAATTLTQLGESALAAAELARGGHRVVLVVGCELSAFMQGIIPGDDPAARLTLLSDPTQLVAAVAAAGIDPFAQFAGILGEAVAMARAHFAGPIAYAAGLWEQVDWTPFDVVAVDAYRTAANRADYVDTLRAYQRHGKPVVVTEVGCATYRGAADQGGLAWTAVDRQVQPRQLRPNVVRDERAQAEEVAGALAAIDAAGLDGAFVYTYVAPSYPSSDDPARDLDTAFFSLVRTWPDGTTQPKEALAVVADYYARQSQGPGLTRNDVPGAA